MPANAGREPLIGYLCGVGLLIIWTSFIILSRLGVSAGFRPLDMAALRLSFAFIAMAPVALRHGLFGLPLGKVAALAVFGGLGMAVFAFHAFQFGTASHAGVLMPGLLPLWAGILAWAMLGQRPGARQWVGLILTIAGGATVGAESFRAIDGDGWRGDILVPFASMSWAVFGTLVRKWKIAVLPAANAVGIGAGVIFMPFWALTTDGALFQAPWQDIVLWGMFQGVLALIISIILYNRAVVALGPVRPALVTSLVPGCVALSAVPILGETLGPLQIAGLLVTMVGMVIALTGPQGTGPQGAPPRGAPPRGASPQRR